MAKLTAGEYLPMSISDMTVEARNARLQTEGKWHEIQHENENENFVIHHSYPHRPRVYPPWERQQHASLEIQARNPGRINRRVPNNL